MKISVFGSTGSIGMQTLDVARHLGIEVPVLASGRNVARMAGQVAEFKPRLAAMQDEEASSRLRAIVRSEGLPTQVLDIKNAMSELASYDEVDKVLNAVVGFAGLDVSISALKAGKALALANKESLVAAGPLMMEAARTPGASILPVDSEHSAIWQCMWSSRGAEVEEIMLTASGGPFRGRKDLSGIRPEHALKHPTWNMGRKITIDSATLINKSLEVIEARWLFDVGEDRIKVVVHPQSIVHSAVMFSDGSVIAQMGSPDMRLPIMAALCYPERSSVHAPGFGVFNLANLGSLTFEEPDKRTFPGVTLGHRALRQGGMAPAAMSAANEEAVSQFLAGIIPFTMITGLCEEAMEASSRLGPSSVGEVLEADRKARSYVESRCRAWHSCHS